MCILVFNFYCSWFIPLSFELPITNGLTGGTSSLPDIRFWILFWDIPIRQNGVNFSQLANGCYRNKLVALSIWHIFMRKQRTVFDYICVSFVREPKFCKLMSVECSLSPINLSNPSTKIAGRHICIVYHAADICVSYCLGKIQVIW